MGIARCEWSLIKTEMRALNKTKIVEKQIRDYEGGIRNHYLTDIEEQIIDWLNKNATITVENTKTLEKRTIEIFPDFFFLSEKVGWNTTPIKVNCRYSEIVGPNGDESVTVKQIWWEDFTQEYEENPMLELKIYDDFSNELLVSKIYRTDSRLLNFLEKNINPPLTPKNGVVYKNRNCRIEINGVDISEYFLNPDTISIASCSLTDYNSCILISKIVDGLHINKP